MAFQENATHYNKTDSFFTDDEAAGTAIFLVSSCGVVANLIVVFWISRSASMQNAFGKLIENQGIGDLISCTLFALYFAPMVFFDITILKTPEVSRYFSHIQLMCYDAGNATHLFASINRVIAIFFPYMYWKIFTIKVARILNAFSWFIAVVPGYYAYFIMPCRLTYSETFWNYIFDINPQCFTVGWYYDFIKSLCTIGTIVILDMATFLKCRILSAGALKTMADQSAKKRKENEINFVTQACLQALVFATEMLTYFYLANFVESRGHKFMLTTLSWVFVPTLDGIISVAFNKEFRYWMKHGKKGDNSRHSQSQAKRSRTGTFQSRATVDTVTNTTKARSSVAPANSLPPPPPPRALAPSPAIAPVVAAADDSAVVNALPASSTPAGPTDSEGPTRTSGPTSTTGFTGSDGPTGSASIRGPSGPAASTDPTSTTGLNGATGLSTPAGSMDPCGPGGPSCPTGSTVDVDFFDPTVSAGSAPHPRVLPPLTPAASVTPE